MAKNHQFNRFFPETERKFASNGRSSDSFPKICAFPLLINSGNGFAKSDYETYSSGNCCRFSRHSLFIWASLMDAYRTIYTSKL